jgi:hypothetical protein
MEPSRKQAIEALYATGHHLLGADRPRDATALFRAMILLAPLDERGWLGLGAAHEALDAPELALELYAAAAVVTRHAPRCAIARVRLLRALGRRGDALDALDAARECVATCQDDALDALIAVERSASWAQ